MALSQRLFGSLRFALIASVCCLATSQLFGQFETKSIVKTGRDDASPSEAVDRDVLFDRIAEELAALEGHGNLLKRVVKLVTPTVVHLESFKPTAGGKTSRSGVEEAGSGVVVQIGDRHFVLTNRHVINNSTLDNIRIRLNDGRFPKPIEVWSDSDTDVAVIEIRAQNLVTARLGDSDKMEIGDFVLAVGSPFGLSHSVSYGIVSAKGRRDLELGSDEIRLQDFLQTDAAINPGNSGGPLLNLRGEVIGINTAIASNSGGNEGVSFAIPIRLVMFVAEQLIEKGSVEQAYLGVTLSSDFGPEIAKRLGLTRVRGALVKEVRSKSPAFFANLNVDDVIVGFNGLAVEDDDHLVNLVSLTPVNQSIHLDVVRNRSPLAVTIKVGRRSKFEN